MGQKKKIKINRKQQKITENERKIRSKGGIEKKTNNI